MLFRSAYNFRNNLMVGVGGLLETPSQNAPPDGIRNSFLAKYAKPGNYSFMVQGYRLNDKSAILGVSASKRISRQSEFAASVIGSKNLYKVDVFYGNERTSLLFDVSQLDKLKAKGAAYQQALTQYINAGVRAWHLSQGSKSKSYKIEAQADFIWQNTTLSGVLGYEKIIGVRGINGVFGLQLQKRF